MTCDSTGRALSKQPEQLNEPVSALPVQDGGSGRVADPTETHMSNSLSRFTRPLLVCKS